MKRKRSVCLNTDKEATGNRCSFTILGGRWHAMPWVFVWNKKDEPQPDIQKIIMLMKKNIYIEKTLLNPYTPISFVACCNAYCVYNGPITTWALNTTDGLVETWEETFCDAFVGKSVVTAEKWNCHAWEILVEYFLFYVSKLLFSTLQSMTFYCIMTE